MRKIYVGLDLGQARDFTAIAALDRTERDGDYDRVTWQRKKIVNVQLRHLERLPLGTSYPGIVEYVDELIRNLAAEAQVELLVDATGVGRPVVDLLHDAVLPCCVRPVLVTGGSQGSYSDGYLKIPKREIITGLQVMLQSGELRISPGLPITDIFLKEMTEMKVKFTGEGNEQFGAWRESTHDDLVFAVALAAWGARSLSPVDIFGKQRLF